MRFAQEGAAVALADRDADGLRGVVEEITRAGGRAVAFDGDLREEAFARGVVDRTVEAFAGLHFLWNISDTPGRPRSRTST